MEYPNWSNYGTPVTGPTYTYGFDAVARPASLTDGAQTWVQNVVYSAAGQITSMQYLQTGGTWLTETLAYNARLQMTSQTVAPAGGGAAWLDLRYNYPAAANNGQLSSLQDLVSGETVSYQYDTLQRLISATAGTAWGNAYSYDGFGNLLAKTVTAGSAPTLSVNVDGTTNRITTAGYSYDLNGNMTAVPGVAGMAYDVDNRLVTANGEAYSYSPVNQRVWLRKSGGTERFTFYDLNGQRLAEYTPWVNGGTLYFVQVKAELYFGGKRIRSGGFAVAEDRLGSTRREDTTASRFFPWGEENGSTANDRQKFATYHRDAGTGLDYANQRYYSATVGRFLTADPYMASGGPADPGSWNRYGYVQGDPVNWIDPSGLDKKDPCPNGDCAPGPPPQVGWPDMKRGTPPRLIREPKTKYPECNKADSATEEANLDFLVNNHLAITSLSESSGVPATWIFGWAVAETGYGTALAARVNHNHFGMSKGGNWTGQIACPAGASDRWACFPTFAASADAALNSSRLDLINGGRYVVASYIVSALVEDPDVSPDSVFQTIADRGHDSGNSEYGTKVGRTVRDIRKRLDCLSAFGYI